MSYNLLSAFMVYFRISLVLIFLLVSITNNALSQQVADDAFPLPEIAPAFKRDRGPVVLMDAYHNNAGLLEGDYRPFGKLLEKDGYRIKQVKEAFTADVLSRGQILLIINPLATENVGNWKLPVFPAFSPHEISAICKWVYNGGALLLTADHMPFPGASETLALEFGVTFTNGFAIDTVHWDPLVFRKSDGSLATHPITNGSNPSEKIDSVASFWGQAFRSSNPESTGLFMFGQNVVSYNPDTAWRFNEHTPVIPVQGWQQGAALSYGKGRALILGEAGMLSAQLVGPRRVPMGMNSPIAKQNLQFILNAMHWLSCLLPVK